MKSDIYNHSSFGFYGFLTIVALSLIFSGKVVLDSVTPPEVKEKPVAKTELPESKGCPVVPAPPDIYVNQAHKV